MTEEETEETLDDEVEKLRREASDFKDKYMRTLAEGENSRKRMQKERQDSVQHAVVDLLREVLLPLDQFEHALAHAEAGSPEIKNWAMGFEMILTHFKEVLNNHNVVPFESKGKPFDPHLHDAVEMVETEEFPEGTVIEEMVRGYRVGERILRPARVKVAAPKQIEEEKQPEESENEPEA